MANVNRIGHSQWSASRWLDLSGDDHGRPLQSIAQCAAWHTVAHGGTIAGGPQIVKSSIGGESPKRGTLLYSRGKTLDHENTRDAQNTEV